MGCVRSGRLAGRPWGEAVQKGANEKVKMQASGRRLRLFIAMTYNTPKSRAIVAKTGNPVRYQGRVGIYAHRCQPPD